MKKSEIARLGLRRAVWGITEREETNKNNFLPIPNNWADFARLTVIRSGDELVKFEPYKEQILIEEIIRKNKITFILKSRQTGVSECITNILLYNALKNPAFLGVVISKGQSDTSNLAVRLRRSFERLGKYAKVTGDSMFEQTFESEAGKGGRILFRNSTINSGRGLESVNMMLFDEASFIQNISEIYAASTPSQVMSGDTARLVVVSTPNTPNDWFYTQLINGNDFNLIDECQEIVAEKKEPFKHWVDERGRAKIILHWLSVPVYKKRKETFLDELRDVYEMTESQIQREFNLSFTHSEQTVFSSALVKSCAIGEWQGKENVDTKQEYYIGIDTALQGEDYFAVTVIKRIRETGVLSVIEIYRQKKRTSDYNIFKTTELIEKYNPKKIVVETNAAGMIIYETLCKDCSSYVIEGFRTSHNTKEALITRLILFMEKMELIFPPHSTLESEFLCFIRNADGKLQAGGGSHDDTVISTALAVLAASGKQHNISVSTF